MKLSRIAKKLIFNRYFLTSLAFAVWMIFFDNNSYKRQRVLNERIGEIHAMRSYYQQEIAKNQKAIYELNTDMETLERYAREKYLMKRDNEDIYIVVGD